MFSICDVTSRYHMFKGLRRFMSGSPSRIEVTPLVVFGGFQSSVSVYV